MIKNCMEDIVDEFLPLVLEEYNDICKCNKCVDDIKALTLNNLKPFYVATEEGSLYVQSNKLNSQFKTDVIREITEAVEVVKNNIHHEER